MENKVKLIDTKMARVQFSKHKSPYLREAGAVGERGLSARFMIMLTGLETTYPRAQATEFVVDILPEVILGVVDRKFIAIGP
jgi:hypothetical protein